MKTLRETLQLTPPQAEEALAALRRVVRADLKAGVASAQLLVVAAAELEVSPEAGAATAESLATAFSQGAARRALVDALVIGACIEGQVSEAREREVMKIAKELGTASHWVELLPALRRGRVLSIKRALVSRSPDAKRMFARVWSEEGVLGGFRAVLFVAGLYRDAPLAARFRALKELAPGTFGRTLYDHMADRGLSFPGEARGIPERHVHHDLMHVVNGYGTDAAGECEVAGFYCGFTPGDSFTFIITVLATFQLGLPVSPDGVTPARGAFDPARVVRAFIRGRQLSVDVMGPWNYWELFPLSMREAQARLGIADNALQEAA